MRTWRIQRTVRRLTAVAAVVAAAAVVTGGCGNKLETGYEPRKLGATETERRGFYAAPFTPEARAAQLQREDDLNARRPRPGY